MKTINVEEFLAGLTLKSGGHKAEQDAYCVMEAVAYIAGEPWSDRPQCACPVITSFFITINDNMDQASRDKWLKPLIPLLVGTRDADKEQVRAYMLADAALHLWTPMSFDIAAEALSKVESLKSHADDMTKQANILRSLPVIDSKSAAKSAAESAKSAKSAAKSAAEYAAEYAAKSAKSAAKSAAEYAAEYAAESAEYAAEYAAESAAKYVAAAAKSAAESAAWSAAWSAKSAAWSAKSAAWDVIGEQITTLVKRMVGAEEGGDA